MPNHNLKENKNRLLEILRETITRDNELREEFKIGDKFRFIRDRLNALLAKTEESLQDVAGMQEEVVAEVSEEESLVYIYLYNTQGLVMQTWQKMLNPVVFYEHSVNRPVYIEKKHVEEFISTKANKAQHGYLTVAVKKEAVLKNESLKDAMEHPIVKVKEGSFRFERVFAFTHQGIDYDVTEEGAMKKQSSST